MPPRSAGNRSPIKSADKIFPEDYYADLLSHLPPARHCEPISESGRVSAGDYAERRILQLTPEKLARLPAKEQAFLGGLAAWMTGPTFIDFLVGEFMPHLLHRKSDIGPDTEL